MRVIAALGSLAVLGLAACGSTTTAGSPASSNPGGASASSPAAAAGTLAVRTTSLGPVLVDARGRTVYLLTADSPGHSSCASSCLRYWPAVPPGASTPTSLPGITATIGTTATMAGGKTLTAGGWPLYTFVQDSKPGDVTGQGVKSFGGTWYAVSPAGKAVTTAPSSSGARGGY
ncbi:MAG: COG4315 family predicted lipoprotein [Oryzihumus sp.]